MSKEEYMPIVYEYENTIPEQNLKKYHLNSLTMSININLKLIFRNIFLNIIVLGIRPDGDFLIYFFFPYLLLMVVTFHREILRVDVIYCSTTDSTVHGPVCK